MWFIYHKLQYNVQMNLWKCGILTLGWSCLYCTVPHSLQKTSVSSEQFWTWSTFITSYWNGLIECVAGLDIHGEMFKGVGIGGSGDQKETWFLSLRVAGLIMQTCLCAVVGSRCRLWLRVKRLIIGATLSYIDWISASRRFSYICRGDWFFFELVFLRSC